ncbi:MAG: hypothetical protein ACRBDI_09625 [Alphaproteobacteria bacterium]
MDRETKKIRDAVQDINSNLRNAGISNLRLNYLDCTEMLSDQFAQKAGMLVHRIECKRDGHMTGAPIEKLGTVFVHHAGEQYLSHADKSATHIRESGFFGSFSSDDSVRESINDSLIDHLLDLDDGASYLLYLENLP